MKDYLPILKKVSLFSGMKEQDLLSILNCLNAQTKVYPKNSMIYLNGEKISTVGVVLSGTVHILKEDVMGNTTILTGLSSGDLFGEVFVCAKIDKIPVSVCAVTESRILFVDYRRILSTCSSACDFHIKLIENMLAIIATKNLLLNQKIEYISKRTTREKLLTFLSVESKKAGSNTFTIPFNREELANYLCVDRSAMSKELCKMRDDGILRFSRSDFELME